MMNTDTDAHDTFSSVRYDETIRLFTDVLTALYRLPAVEWKFQEPQFQREFNAAFGPERQAQVCRNWIARLARDK